MPQYAKALVTPSAEPRTLAPRGNSTVWCWQSIRPLSSLSDGCQQSIRRERLVSISRSSASASRMARIASRSM